MDFIQLGNIILAFWITLFLIICHLISHYITNKKYINTKKLTSFASGAALAYVFLHMLPELVEGNAAIGAVLQHTVTLTPLVDLAIFIIALIGFNFYFGLEIIAQKTHSNAPKVITVYRLHLLMYGIYNFLITYTMPLRVQTGVVYAGIFSIVMGLHFILTDRHFNLHFSRQFNHGGRFFLLAALLLGWGVTAMTNPINVFIVSLMIAFLSGSILYNVFHRELPNGKDSSFISFTLGIVIIGALLLLNSLHLFS